MCFKTMKNHYKILFPKLRKLKEKEDFCTTCHELKRDILDSEEEKQYDKAKILYQEHILLAAR